MPFGSYYLFQQVSNLPFDHFTPILTNLKPLFLNKLDDKKTWRAFGHKTAGHSRLQAKKVLGCGGATCHPGGRQNPGITVLGISTSTLMHRPFFGCRYILTLPSFLLLTRAILEVKKSFT